MARKLYIAGLILAVALGAKGQTAGGREQAAMSAKELHDSLSAAAYRLSFHPDSLELRLEKASWNMLLEQWDYALGEYDYVLKREPKNVVALYFRAYANTKLHRYKFARLDYETLLATEPGHFGGRLGLALLCNRDHRPREAMDLMNSLCEDYPNRAEAYAARAEMELERGWQEVAEYDYEQAVRLEPQNLSYRARLEEVKSEKRKVKSGKKGKKGAKSNIPRGKKRKFINPNKI